MKIDPDILYYAILMVARSEIKIDLEEKFEMNMKVLAKAVAKQINDADDGGNPLPKEWIKCEGAIISGETPVYFFSDQKVGASFWKYKSQFNSPTHYCLRYVPSPPVEESARIKAIRGAGFLYGMEQDLIEIVKRHEAKVKEK